MTIREYAARIEHEVVGKLTRRPEFEVETLFDGSKVRLSKRVYWDEAKNEYIIDSKGRICIVTADGGVIASALKQNPG